jgi:hypothetical protein
LNHLTYGLEAQGNPEKDAGNGVESQGKIEQGIEELDWDKRDVLKTTWEKVNG